MNGFFKLHYNIKNWEHWHNPNILVVWIHLLARARWDDKPIRYKGVLIKRGQLLIGRKEFSEECGLSEQQVRTVLNTLKSTNEITTEATNKGTLVSVVNYSLWQDKTIEATNVITSSATNEQPASNQPATSQQPLNNKEYKDNKDYKDINRAAEDRGLNMKIFRRLRNKEWA